MINKYLKKIFFLLKEKQKLVLIILISLFLFSVYFKYLILLVFILAGGFSKFYHRFFKSSLGIDLVLFTTIMTMLVYKNIILGFTVAWVGLLMAEVIGNKLSYTSIVSIILLSLIVIMSTFFLDMPLIPVFIILVLTFEGISIILYHLMGSPPHKILVYLGSHLLFNLFLIFSFAEKIYLYLT